MTVKVAIAAFIAMALTSPARGQIPDQPPGVYLADASEEYWPADTVREPAPFRKSLPVFHGKGSLTNGASIREGFEYFRDYLWGIGPQDHNGFLLHRALVHSDLRYGRHFRLFAELQSSLISGRNGGPRPVQDLNELAVNQLFGEVTVHATAGSRLRLRLGKQHLNYGQGTLLDLRDANVRRPFVGGKLQFEAARYTLDIFAMKAVAAQKGVFDDGTGQGQKIGGLWLTRNFAGPLVKADIYYLLINRDRSLYNQGIGKERRHTAGTGLTFNSGNWFSFSELDFQWGKFGMGKIAAMKIASSLGYRFGSFGLQPVVSIAAAVSSGDSDAGDGRLGTFNPIYPKAVFYGFIDNVGSSNLVVIHPKTELTVKSGMTLTLNYYRFWRQSTADGIYAVNGSFLLPASAAGARVGDMFDIYAQYRAGKHWAFQLVAAYYIRGPYLKQNTVTNSEILYFGLKAAVHI